MGMPCILRSTVIWRIPTRKESHNIWTLEKIFSIRKYPSSRNWGQLYTTIKTQKPSQIKVREFSLALALLSSWRFFHHWLNLQRVFGRYPIGALWSVLFFCSSGAPIGTCVDEQLIDNFCASSDYVNKAIERVEKNDVRYGFVVDVAGSKLDQWNKYNYKRNKRFNSV